MRPYTRAQALAAMAENMLSRRNEDDEERVQPSLVTHKDRIPQWQSRQEAKRRETAARLAKLRERGLRVRTGVRPQWANEPGARVRCTSCARTRSAQEMAFCAFCGKPFCGIDCYSPHLDKCES